MRVAAVAPGSIWTTALRPSTLRPQVSFLRHKSLPLSARRSITSYGYTQAKALVYSKYGEPQDVLYIHGHSISPPSSTTVVVRMLTCPINPADVNQIQGVYPSKPEMNTLLGTSEPSAVAGNEGVGEVINTGSGVKTIGKGDWVIMKSTGMGTWRTHMAVDESQLLKIDDKQGLTPLQVGTVSVNPCTAYRMILDSATWGFRGDEWFIQNGANSGVGRAAIQLGREWGFKSINVIRGREDKAEEQKLRDELTQLGATQVITEEELMGRSMKDQIKEWTNGGRELIKVGLNCVGGKPGTALAKFLSPGGTMVTYGAMSKQPLALPASLLIFKDLNFTGFWVSSWSDKHPNEKKQTVEDVLRLTREGKFKDIPVEQCSWAWKTEAEILKRPFKAPLEDSGQVKAYSRLRRLEVIQKAENDSCPRSAVRTNIDPLQSLNVTSHIARSKGRDCWNSHASSTRLNKALKEEETGTFWRTTHLESTKIPDAASDFR